VSVLPYKEDGTHFKSISRQTLFHGEHDLPVEIRYFEIQAEGYSTLERHQHAHLVMVIQGSGKCLVGDKVFEVGLFDIVHVPPLTWHQFRALNGETLGIHCLVNTDRDRPQRPGPVEIEELKASQEVGEFIRY